MNLTIEPTEKFFMAGDVMVRMWQGWSDIGEPVIVLVAAVAFSGQAEAVAEGLISIPPPSPEAAKRWAEEVFRRQERPE